MRPQFRHVARIVQQQQTSNRFQSQVSRSNTLCLWRTALGPKSLNPEAQDAKPKTLDPEYPKPESLKSQSLNPKQTEGDRLINTEP